MAKFDMKPILILAKNSAVLKREIQKNIALYGTPTKIYFSSKGFCVILYFEDTQHPRKNFPA